MPVMWAMTPMSSMATRPRRRWQSRRVSQSFEAPWTQPSRLFTLAPVSSKCTVSAWRSSTRTCSVNSVVPSARTPPALGTVLGDEQGDLGEVEDLAPLGVDDRGTAEPRPTRPTRLRGVNDGRIGIIDLGEVLAVGAGLLARLSLGCRTPLSPRRRLGQPFSRRRHRGVPWRAAEADFEITKPLFELPHPSTQFSVLADQILVGGDGGLRGRNVGRNSQRYARRIPWWWMRRSGDLSSYPQTTGLQPGRGCELAAPITGPSRGSGSGPSGEASSANSASEIGEPAVAGEDIMDSAALREQRKCSQH